MIRAFVRTGPTLLKAAALPAVLATLLALAPAGSATALPGLGDITPRAAAPPRIDGLVALLGQPVGASPYARTLVCDSARLPPGRTDCRVARRYGAYVIDAPPQLTAKIGLKRLTLHAQGSDVRAVSFETSPDNFNRIVSLLTVRFGPPDRHRNDDVASRTGPRPRVLMSWTSAAVVISLTDPTPRKTLQVRLSSTL